MGLKKTCVGEQVLQSRTWTLGIEKGTVGRRRWCSHGKTASKGSRAGPLVLRFKDRRAKGGSGAICCTARTIKSANLAWMGIRTIGGTVEVWKRPMYRNAKKAMG